MAQTTTTTISKKDLEEMGLPFVPTPQREIDGGFKMNTCTRCGHHWIQRKKGGQSVKCPSCKSTYWARQYTNPWHVQQIKKWHIENKKEREKAEEEEEKETKRRISRRRKTGTAKPSSTKKAKGKAARETHTNQAT
jgi:hypothetical protein